MKVVGSRTQYKSNAASELLNTIQYFTLHLKKKKYCRDTKCANCISSEIKGKKNTGRTQIQKKMSATLSSRYNFLHIMVN